MDQADRVIVLRGQASLQQGPYSVGAVLARELGAAVYQAHRGLNVGAVLGLGGIPTIQATRCIRQTALSFFAGKPRSNRDRIPLERCLPAIWAARCIRKTESSFFAGKHRSHRGCWQAGRHRCLAVLVSSYRCDVARRQRGVRTAPLPREGITGSRGCRVPVCGRRRSRSTAGSRRTLPGCPLRAFPGLARRSGPSGRPGPGGGTG